MFSSLLSLDFYVLTAVSNSSLQRSIRVSYNDRLTLVQNTERAAFSLSTVTTRDRNSVCLKPVWSEPSVQASQ